MRRIESGLAFVIKHKAEKLMLNARGQRPLIGCSIRARVNGIGIYPIDNEEFFLY